jgi:hypothetical protein
VTHCANFCNKMVPNKACFVGYMVFCLVVGFLAWLAVTQGWVRSCSHCTVESATLGVVAIINLLRIAPCLIRFLTLLFAFIGLSAASNHVLLLVNGGKFWSEWHTSGMIAVVLILLLLQVVWSHCFHKSEC